MPTPSIDDDIYTPAAAVGAANDNPDKAAEAINISKVTGAPAPTIYDDLDNFKATIKQQSAGAIAADNPQIRRLTSDPMKARVTNDDLATLDSLSAPLNKVAQPGVWSRLGAAAQRAATPFVEGFDAQVLADDYRALYNFSSSPVWHGLVAASSPGNPALLAVAASHLFSGATEAASRGIADVYQAAGGEQLYSKLTGMLPESVFGSAPGPGSDRGSADALAHDLTVAAQTSFAPEAHLPIEFNELARAAKKAKPFVDAGVAPPAGIDPTIDAVHVEQNHQDLGALKEALAQAQESTTRQRAPDVFKEYVEQHTQGASIGINADAIRDLYGGEVPVPGDDKLGFVSDLPAQLLRATVTGQDVQIPISDWLTHVDPATASQLEDYTRTRPGNVTDFEAKGLAPTDAEDPVDTLRHVSGLSPRTPETQYQFMQEPVPADQSVQWLKQGEPGGDKLLIQRSRGTDHYVNVGEAENTVDAIDQLRKIAGPLPPMEEAAAGMARKVLEHVGADGVPLYTVDAGHPAIQNANGMYYPGADAIVLRNRPGMEARSLRTTVHEAYHAAFHAAIEGQPDTRAGVEKLLGWSRDAERIEATGSVVNDVRGGFKTDDGATSNHYGHSNAHEFISEAFSNPEFAEHLSKTKLSPEQEASLGLGDMPKSRLASAWDAMLMLARKAFGLPLTDESLSLLDATFKLGDRLTAVSNRYRDEPGVEFSARPLAQRDPIFDHASAIGMNAKQAERYRAAIEKQRSEEADAKNSAILREEERRQTKEWKDNEVEMRKSVADDLRTRPDVMADAILRGRDKLDTDALTAEQRAALGDAHTRGGLDPDALAQQVGFDTGDQLVDAVAKLRRDRGDMQPVDYARKMVRDETARRMEAQYGNLRENVIEAAKERVLSETQMDILHGDAAAQGLPVTKEQLKANVADVVGQIPVGKIDSTAAMAAAGRAASAIEDALLKGDAKEAFAQRMRQINHLLAAKEMVRIEKAKAQFEKLAKRYSNPTVAGAAQEYVDQMRGVLDRLGRPVKGALRADTDFVSFINEKAGDYRSMHVPDFLFDPDFRKKLEDLPAQDFEAVHKAMKAIAFNARDEMKIIRAGEKVDFRQSMDELTAQVRETGKFKELPTTVSRRSPSRILSQVRWSHEIFETFMNQLDRGDWAGRFNQTVTRLYTDQANYRERLLSEYRDKMNEIGRIDNYEKDVENNLFRNPDPENPYLLQMKRRHVLGALQYAGEPEALRKLAGGFKLQPAQVLDWLFKNTTKEDWDRAQAIGDHGNALYDLADKMSQSVSGVPLDRVEIKPINTPFGTYDGWHNPVQYSYVREGKSKTLMGSDGLDQHGYFNAIAPPKGYTKARTAYIAPVELDLGVAMKRMEQMIHDIAMRPALIQLSKIFKDQQFRDAVAHYHGLSQRDMLLPFLRDMAGDKNFNSEAASAGNAALSWISSNTISTLVGFNPRTVMKHSSTAFAKSFLSAPVGFARETLGLFRDVDGQTNWQMAFDKSDELRRRGQNWQQVWESSGTQIGLRKSGGYNRFSDLRSFMQSAGSAVLNWTDVASAVPHWLAVYKEAIANGEDEGMAVTRADADVRKTHGSSIFTNKPPIARNSSPAAKAYASLYGFFSENLQKQFEIAWRAREAVGAVRNGELGDAWNQTRKIGSLVLTSVIIPAVIEEAVASEFDDKKNSFGTHAFHIAVNGLTSGFIGIRDIAGAITSGHDPNINIFTAPVKAITDDAKDMRDAIVAAATNKPLGPAKTARVIRDSAAAFGYLTGLAPMQLDRAGEYAYRYTHGLEHPKGPEQLARGIVKGHTK